MKLKLIIDVLKRKDKNFFQNIFQLLKYFKYYVELKKNIRNDNLFLGNNDDKKFKNLLEKITEDDKHLLEEIFNKNIKSLLENRNLKQKLDFTKQNDFIQVGSGLFRTKEPVPGLWTTGKAFFYMPIIPEKENKFKLELFSIPSLSIEIGFEDQTIIELQMSELNQKTIDFTIKPNEATNNIGEIFINTNKLWLPNVILKNQESILLGIGVKSIENRSIDNL